MSWEIIFESTACDFCGSTKTRVLFEGPDRLLGLPGHFRVVQCVQCGLLRQDPRPTRETISFYYPLEYEPFAIDKEHSCLRRWERRYGMFKRRRAIERRCSGGRLLDVGCATGDFLYEMARSGRWEVEGVEPNAEAARYGQEHFGLTIHVGELKTVDLPAKAYDVITMWDVFEHLHDPMANLRIIARLLKPGGWFVFSIPNVESWERWLFGKHWRGWELPRHLYFPTRKLMTAMLHEVGMDIQDWQCFGGVRYTFLTSMRFWLEEAVGRGFLTSFVLTLNAVLFMQPFIVPLIIFLKHFKLASIITGFARLIVDQ
jgi:SAM-dependent methyltransferase